MTELFTFLCQGTLVYLLGIQTLNVAGRHYFLAGATSFLLAMAGFYTNAAVAHAGFAGIFGSVWWSYCLAGVFSVPLSMWSHPQLVAWYERIINSRKRITDPAELLGIDKPVLLEQENGAVFVKKL